MNIRTYIIRRLLFVIPMLIGITLITFLISKFVPTNPIVIIIGEKSLDDPEIVAFVTQKWGLDLPLYKQYFFYIYNLLQGDLGVSFTTKRPVIKDLLDYFPATIELSATSIMYATSVGIPLGMITAYKSGKTIDHIVRLFSLILASMPPFWSGLVGLHLLCFTYDILPGPGRIDNLLNIQHSITGLYMIDTIIQGNFRGFFDVISHLILPSIILGSYITSLILRTTRSSVLEELNKGYVTAARGRGIPESRILCFHILRNAFIPILTVISLSFGKLMLGAIMTESVFAWPGIGCYAVAAAANLDYPAIMGITLLTAIIFIIISFIVDILYFIIDPRICKSNKCL